jgi:hypothetical protein
VGVRLGGALGSLQELIDGAGEGVEGGAQDGGRRWRRCEHLRQAGTEHPQVDATAEEGAAQTLVGGVLALGTGRAHDQAVQPQPAPVVGDAAGCEGARVQPQQGGQLVTPLALGEATRHEGEEHDRTQECLHAGVAEAQSGDPLLIDDLGLGEPLDVQQTSSGGAANRA